MKASENIKRYHNPSGAEVSTVDRRILQQDGLTFKDIDGSGTVSAVNDWRKTPKERAHAYIEILTTKEKIAQLFISDWQMGKYPGHDGAPVKALDETGLLDEGEYSEDSIFGTQFIPKTTTLLKEWFNRHIILRANATPYDMADWMNQMNAVCEECEHFIPLVAASNSRNENGEQVFGMNDAVGTMATWPGTLGIAAAVQGSGIHVADIFADTVRQEWNACGLRKGYMYMADVVTDPRWQRTYGTFGENPALVSQIMEHIIPRIQGSKNGVTSDGIALTTKHFPGGGPRDNGFDPHYAAGQWNVYPTPGSLTKYHLPPFETAVKAGTSSIMPYYSKPSEKKSAAQFDGGGNPIVMEPYGFAYNKYFIDDLLRKKMGFKGYINSDTGIVHNMCWGVEALDVPERIAFAVNHAGVDVISGLFDNEAGMEAYERGKTDYYKNHPVPEDFEPKDLVLTDEVIDRAAERTLTELFALGMVDDPYRDPDEAERIVKAQTDGETAYEAHCQSVVLLKNDGTLPLSKGGLVGKKIYAEVFMKDPEQAKIATQKLHDELKGCSLTDMPQEADYALLFVTPSSGEYFNATKGYLELDICEGKMVHDVDERGKPLPETHLETTLSGLHRLKEAAESVHKNHGKVITNVNFTLAWELGNIEPLSDVLLAGFDTFRSATLDVIFGDYAPTGKLPLTLPRGDEVLTVDANGVCISPNDVPGFDKDLYMPEALKDENGKAYAYRDSTGNYYEYSFGL